MKAFVVGLTLLLSLVQVANADSKSIEINYLDANSTYKGTDLALSMDFSLALATACPDEVKKLVATAGLVQRETITTLDQTGELPVQLTIVKSKGLFNPETAATLSATVTAGRPGISISNCKLVLN